MLKKNNNKNGKKADPKQYIQNLLGQIFFIKIGRSSSRWRNNYSIEGKENVVQTMHGQVKDKIINAIKKNTVLLSSYFTIPELKTYTPEQYLGTPLLWALEIEDGLLADEMLKLHKNLNISFDLPLKNSNNKVDIDYRYPFFEVVRLGYHELAQKIFAMGAKITEESGADGISVIHLLVIRNWSDLVLQVLDRNPVLINKKCGDDTLLDLAFKCAAADKSQYMQGDQENFIITSYQKPTTDRVAKLLKTIKTLWQKGAVATNDTLLHLNELIKRSKKDSSEEAALTLGQIRWIIELDLYIQDKIIKCGKEKNKNLDFSDEFFKKTGNFSKPDKLIVAQFFKKVIFSNVNNEIKAIVLSPFVLALTNSKLGKIYQKIGEEFISHNLKKNITSYSKLSRSVLREKLCAELDLYIEKEEFANKGKNKKTSNNENNNSLFPKQKQQLLRSKKAAAKNEAISTLKLLIARAEFEHGAKVTLLMPHIKILMQSKLSDVFAVIGAPFLADKIKQQAVKFSSNTDKLDGLLGEADEQKDDGDVEFDEVNLVANNNKTIN